MIEQDLMVKFRSSKDGTCSKFSRSVKEIIIDVQGEQSSNLALAYDLIVRSYRISEHVGVG